MAEPVPPTASTVALKVKEQRGEPGEVRAGPGDQEEYDNYRTQTDLRAPYRIGAKYLEGTQKNVIYDAVEFPVIVFVNARSGGNTGPEVAGALARALGASQVFDLGEYRPDKVLRQLWANLTEREAAGDSEAGRTRRRLRILAAGGDGTIAWIMGVIKDLNLDPHPPIAIMPLGTGNDLSRSFRWGGCFEWKWIKQRNGLYNTLKRVADAKVVDLDCWAINIMLPGSKFHTSKVHSLQVVETAEDEALAAADKPAVDGGAFVDRRVLLSGLFWNYFSIGLDAEAAFNFHHLREQHPTLAKSRAQNQFWYSVFSCTSGWFCCGARPVCAQAELQVQRPDSTDWVDLPLPRSVKAVVLVNLQSYGGGRNIWGSAPSTPEEATSPPHHGDGLIEVVGLKHGCHAACVMATGGDLVHGERLAQVTGVRLKLKGDKSTAESSEPQWAYMQVDGEPWHQLVPSAKDNCDVQIEILNAGKSKLLLNEGNLDGSELAVQRILDLSMTQKYLSPSGHSHESQEAILQRPSLTLLQAQAAQPQPPAEASAAAPASGSSKPPTAPGISAEPDAEMELVEKRKAP